MSRFTDALGKEFKTYIERLNANPEKIESVRYFVVRSKFDWDFMAILIRGLSAKWLMDKAIQVMVDAWDECLSRNEEFCYKNLAYQDETRFDEQGAYTVKVPTIRDYKYPSLDRALKTVRDEELERREVDAKFKKNLSPSMEQEEPQFTYTEDTFKKSAMITDMQLKLVLAELIVSGWMPKTSCQSDFCKLFSGVKSKFFLTWTGKPADLRDFFDMLTRKKVVSSKEKEPGYITPRRNYLNIVCSHFKDAKGKWFEKLNHQRHNESSKEVLSMLEIILTNSLDECIKMMKTIATEYKDLLEDIDFSFKPEHPSNFGRIRKSVK